MSPNLRKHAVSSSEQAVWLPSERSDAASFRQETKIGVFVGQIGQNLGFV